MALAADWWRGHFVNGVTAGRAGEFGFVVGVDRVGQAEDLAAAGADVVVTDLDQLLVEGP